MNPQDLKGKICIKPFFLSAQGWGTEISNFQTQIPI